MLQVRQTVTIEDQQQLCEGLVALMELKAPVTQRGYRLGFDPIVCVGTIFPDIGHDGLRSEPDRFEVGMIAMVEGSYPVLGERELFATYFFANGTAQVSGNNARVSWDEALSSTLASIRRYVGIDAERARIDRALAALRAFGEPDPK